MRIFFGVVLFLLAILSGGCSLVFTTTIFQDLGGSADVVMIWASGLLLGALSLWGAIALFRSPAQRDERVAVIPEPKDGRDGH